MSKAIQVRIKSKTVKGMYLDCIDAIIGVAIPYVGENAPTFGKREATKMVNYLNQLESSHGYVKHEWTIEKA